MAPPSDDAIKQRVIGHMNKDHQDSVIRYAEYYGKASRFASRNAMLKDISLEKLTVAAGGQTLVIPLDPPMSNLSEARVKLVDMDKQSVAGLNRSPVTLKEYRAPKGFPIVVFVACLGTYILLSSKANLLPGSLMYDNILGYLPRFAEFVYNVRDYVIWPMLAIHITEAYLMSGTLRKHSVPLFSRLWCLWMASCFIEGFDSFKRIWAYEKEKLAKQAQH